MDKMKQKRQLYEKGKNMTQIKKMAKSILGEQKSQIDYA